MPRSVETWIGKTPDSPAPPRVRLRVFERCEGKCGQCGRKIRPGEHWTLEHLIALINGGRNAEDNLGVTCDWCLPAKNAADVKQKAKSARIRAKHYDTKEPSRGFRKPEGMAFNWRTRRYERVEQ
jgi:5-methylcytosine-specific restriction protein A